MSSHSVVGINSPNMYTHPLTCAQNSSGLEFASLAFMDWWT